jgi:serine/threonine protein kinase, bacterial
VKLAAGSATQTVLPFTGINNPYGVAVDSAGNLYVTDAVNNQVVKLPAG